jgi:hypothetical protein
MSAADAAAPSSDMYREAFDLDPEKAAEAFVRTKLLPGRKFDK